MASKVPTAAAATPRDSLAAVRPTVAKAEIREQVGATTLRAVAADALRKVTSQKAAAADLDLSEGRLSHKLQDGTLNLAQLEALGPRYASELGRLLVEQSDQDPKTLIRRAIRDARAKLDEAAELMAEMA